MVKLSFYVLLHKGWLVGRTVQPSARTLVTVAATGAAVLRAQFACSPQRAPSVPKCEGKWTEVTSAVSCCLLLAEEW